MPDHFWRHRKTASNDSGVVRERVRESIDTIIEIVTVVKDFVPMEPVKGSLGALCALLKLLQMYLENDDELAEIAKWCQDVAMIVKRAAESGHFETDTHLLNALEELQRFIDDVCQEIKEKQRRGTLRRFFGAHRDGDKIRELKEKLNDFLRKFQIHLQVTQSMNMVEILAWVKAQPIQPIGTQSGSVKYHTPPKPTIFFGREAVMIEIVEAIQRRQHVMLIGTGGIGKSSIAKAVLNENSLAFMFKAKLFITYDGVVSSAMTYQLFLDRIASALKLSNSNYDNIMGRLETLSALLVIDNAETLLDAGDVDAGRIAEFLDTIGGLDCIRVIVTTRNHSNVSANFSCKRITVGGISMDAACRAFSAVYTVAPVSDALKSTFTALDYHPLSINILANAAVMNEWSPEEIVKAWHERQDGVLENANDKYRSLRATIEISIATFKGSSSVALQILRAIAFLPQGVHRDDFCSIFPSIPDISLQAEAVHRSSLIYRDGERFTMLAPIRMYISGHYNKNLTYDDQVLSNIRAYFHSELSGTAHGFVDREHGNIDRLMHFDMTSARYRNDIDTHLVVLDKVESFLYCVHDQPISLWQLLETEAQIPRPSIDEATSILITFTCQCLTWICWIDVVRSRCADCLAKLQVVETYCHRYSPLGDRLLVECLRLKAAVFEMLGDVTSAIIALRKALSVAEALDPPLDTAFLRNTLAPLLSLSGETEEAKALLQASEEQNLWPSDFVFLAQVAIFESRFTDAQILLARSKELTEPDHYNGGLFLYDMVWQASCEGSAGEFPAALKILQAAAQFQVGVGARQFRNYADAIEGRAYYEARLGYMDDARRTVAQLLQLWSEYGEWSWSGNFVRASVESLAGEHGKAMSILQMMLDRQQDRNKRNLAATHQGLGELLQMENRHVEARAQFEQAKAIYDSTGLSPKHFTLRSLHWLHSIGSNHDGWDRYLEEIASGRA